MQFLPNKAHGSMKIFIESFGLVLEQVLGSKNVWLSKTRLTLKIQKSKNYQVVESKLAEICNQKSIKGPSFIIFIKGDTKTNKILIQVLSRLYPYFCF